MIKSEHKGRGEIVVLTCQGQFKKMMTKQVKSKIV